MILIVGASGRRGGVVVEQLLAQGKSVRVLTRTPHNLAHLQEIGAEGLSVFFLTKRYDVPYN